MGELNAGCRVGFLVESCARRLGRAWLQPCRPEPAKTRASAPEACLAAYCLGSFRSVSLIALRGAPLNALWNSPKHEEKEHGSTFDSRLRKEPLHKKVSKSAAKPAFSPRAEDDTDRINTAADQLNSEVEDVQRYQNLDE
jgi:hypothetical protein